MKRIVRERIKVYKHDLVYTRKQDSSWKFEAKDLGVLTKALGEDLLIAFLRCFVWADRLQSLGHFLYLDKSESGSLTSLRNLHTAAWLAGGAVYEAADAINALEKAGVDQLLTDKTEWKRLRAMAMRWRRNKILVRFRNNLAFHADPKVVKKGLRRAIAIRERVTIIGGDTAKAGHASIRLGMDVLLLGLGLSEHSFKSAITTQRSDHLSFGGHVQRLFAEALRGIGSEV